MLSRRLPYTRRPAFTLLEVTLASAIGLLIMYGLYLAISVQLKFAEAGRYAVGQATLARSLTARIANDLTPSIGMPDPSRFRQSSQSGQSGQSGAGGTTPMSGSTTPSTTTPSSTTPSSTTPSSTTPSSTTPSSTTTTTTTTTADSNGIPVQALYGDSSSLRGYVSRVPPLLGGGSNPETSGNEVVAVKSDQRVIEYWLASNGGLARQEIAVVTASADNLPLARGSGDEGQYVIAPEVTNVEFSYFDGTDWQTTWDSTALGPDDKTPMGPPLAIAIVLEITTPATADRAERVQTYRHVISIPTANGLPQSTDSMGQTNGTSSGSSSGSGMQP